MAIKGYMESTLSQSEVFQGFDDAMKIKEKAVKLIQNSRHLTNEDIEAAYIQVKQITDSLTMEAVKAFDNEKTVLVYNNVPKLSMSQAIPFLTFKRGENYVTYIFVDKYITNNRDNVLTIQPSILRDLLTGAVVANGLKYNYDQLAGNQYMQKICMEIYTQIFCRIINREFSIAADKNVYEVVQYYVNRFFLQRVFGAADTPDNIDKLAKKHVKYIDEIAIDNMRNVYDDADPSNITELLDMFKELTPRMKSAGYGRFVNDWINYVHDAGALAIDNMEYLLFVILCLLSGSSIINISLGDIVKEAKNIKSFRAELLKIVKG